MLLHFFNQCFNTCIVYSNIFVVKVLEGYGEVFQSVRWPPKQHSKVLNMVLIFKSTQQNLECFWDFLNINVNNLSNYGIIPDQIKSEKTK